MSESWTIDTPRRSRRWRVVCVGGAALLLFAGLVGAARAASTDFFEPASSPEAAGLGPVSVTAADLEGDGDRDLTAADVSGGNVTILKNAGLGNFVEPASSPEAAGSFPSALTAADLDGDGDRDLAIADHVADHSVTILKNNGSGNLFQPPLAPSRLAATRPRSRPPISTGTETWTSRSQTSNPST